MSNEPETLSVELIAAVKSAVESTTGIEFSTFLNSYLEKNSDQTELTEVDLVIEILEAGEYQQEDESGFEDAVMIGVSAMGEDLGLF